MGHSWLYRLTHKKHEDVQNYYEGYVNTGSYVEMLGVVLLCSISSVIIAIILHYCSDYFINTVPDVIGSLMTIPWDNLSPTWWVNVLWFPFRLCLAAPTYNLF